MTCEVNVVLQVPRNFQPESVTDYFIMPIKE